MFYILAAIQNGYLQYNGRNQLTEMSNERFCRRLWHIQPLRPISQTHSKSVHAHRSIFRIKNWDLRHGTTESHS